MVHGAYVAGHEAGFGEVGSSLEPHGKGVKPWPVGWRLAVVLDAARGIALGNGRYHRRVEAAAQQHPIGHIAHELALDSGIEGIAQPCHCLMLVERGMGHSLVAHPVARVVALEAGGPAVVVVAGQEGLVVVAMPFKRLELAGHHDLAVGGIAHIERNHPYRVARHQKLVVLGIVEGKGKDAVQLLEHGYDGLVSRHALATQPAVEGQDDLAVAAGEKPVGAAQPCTQLAVIVDLAVHGQHLLAVGGIEGLAARLGVDDAQALVGQNGRTAAIDAAPVGAAVTQLAAHAQRHVAQLGALLSYIENCYYSTHKRLNRFKNKLSFCKNNGAKLIHFAEINNNFKSYCHK